MNPKATYKWIFRARFRRHAFGWRSQPAIKRIKEAVSEIRKVARKTPETGAEGAVLFFEKISPAIEQIDGSSGAIGTAVNNAIGALVPVILKPSVNGTIRNNWLERLWTAVENDGMSYLDSIPDCWGELCVSPKCASSWADRFIDTVKLVWNQDSAHGYFNGTPACLSSLLRAGRNEELLELIELAPYKWLHYRKWGVKALIAMGRKEEAIRYAEDSKGLNDSPSDIAEICEELLLAEGKNEKAYNEYAKEANQNISYLATFKAIVKKYPHKEPTDILRNLIASTPGDEGKWFASAKSAGLYNEAIRLANTSPCDPKTLTRAARDMETKKPQFAIEAGLAAIHWLIKGYGYDVTGMDVRDAYNHTLRAAENAELKAETIERIRKLITDKDDFASNILNQEIGLNK